MSDVHNTILNLERDYAVHKEKFEGWKKSNSSLSGNPTYNRYVDQFVTWEKGVFEQLRELRSSAARQPVAPEPQLPMVDLDTQLNEALSKVTQAEFMVAIFAMAQKDSNFLPKVFEVVQRESRGTGYYNPIMSKQNIQSYTTPMPLLYSTNNSYSGAKPFVNNGASGVASNSVHIPHKPNFSVYTQSTPYGAIPEGWVVDEPIRKRQKFPSPTRDYRNTNLPFKDFSQS